MSSFAIKRLVFSLAALLLMISPIRALAQSDPNETPLGDVARNLRNRKTTPAQGVIDDDNLSQVMKQAENHRPSGTPGLTFEMTGETKGFHVSTPDATCSLAFSANAKTLLSSQYAQMELPLTEMDKLAGPATIEGDAFTVSVMNGTDWHVSEVTVALTVLKKSKNRDASLSDGTGSSFDVPGLPQVDSASLSQESDVRPEKKPDLTMIYRMRAAAPPFAKTTFSAPLNFDLTPEEEWHWAIVQARGYPPQSYSSGRAEPPAPMPAVPSSLLAPPSEPAATAQNAQ